MPPAPSRCPSPAAVAEGRDAGRHAPGPSLGSALATLAVELATSAGRLEDLGLALRDQLLPGPASDATSPASPAALLRTLQAHDHLAQRLDDIARALSLLARQVPVRALEPVPLAELLEAVRLEEIRSRLHPQAPAPALPAHAATIAGEVELF